VTDAPQIADRYIALWNETDQARRRAPLAEGWAGDATSQIFVADEIQAEMMALLDPRR
jgi:hypothetical protein